MTAIQALLLSQAITILAIGALCWMLLRAIARNSADVRNVSLDVKVLAQVMADNVETQGRTTEGVTELLEGIHGLIRANYPRPSDLTIEHQARTASLKALETIALNLGIIYGPEVAEAFRKLEAWSDTKASNDLLVSTLARGEQ